MSDRGSRSPKERASNERGTKVPKAPETRQRRISRAEREAKRQRQIRLGIGITAVALLAVLIGFATWDYVIKPRQVLATVDGTRIRREDYWKFRKFELYQQMAQYSQFSQMVGDQQQAQQYSSLALQAQTQMNDVWGSTSVNDATLQQMIDNIIYVQSLDDFNLTITDEELELWTLNQFAPSETPLIEPTVTPTFVPERAAWATQTTEALTPTVDVAPTESADSLTPIGGASPSADESPAASPEIATTEVASPIASPMASPEIGGATPIVEASPVVTMEPTPTMSAEQARTSAETEWQSYQTSVLSQAEMSVEDYYRLSARPQLAQQKIQAVITEEIGQTADQIHARHILVATEELANQLYSDITGGVVDFVTAAAQSSTDTSTAPNGGDLGWFSRGVMVAPFEEVAFATPAGSVAPPVQSPFGWHIIEVLETQDDRALTDDQISQLQSSAMQNWLTEQQQRLSISSVMAPTPTPASSSFVPPIDAPPVPTEAPVIPTVEFATPEASPIVTEEATPIADMQATPAASPVATEPVAPVASPVMTEEATPVASPVVTEEAAPVASPVVTEETTPVASPAVTEEASPVASPAVTQQATPVASPIATPLATPVATQAASSATVVVVATPAPDSTPVTGVSTPEDCYEASPVASPFASPMASPYASPSASPMATPSASPVPCATP